MKTITIPVEDAGTYDVIVIGGGLSGCCAAIASARNGAKTLLVEGLAYFGGNGIIGLPISSLNATDSMKRIVGGIPYELIQRLEKKNAAVYWKEECEKDWMCVDCEQLQIELTHMLDDAGVELLSHSPMIAVEKEGRRITSAIFLNKENHLRYTAKVFVDSTGDAQVAVLAGLPAPMGRQSDGKTQPMSLTFILSNVSDDRASLPEIKKIWATVGEQRGGWINPRTSQCEPFPVAGKPGTYLMNVTRILVDKGTDNRLLTEAEKIGRYQVEEYVDGFLRPHVRGFEKCILSQIACRVGVRETRRISGIYELQREDLATQKHFPDAIACNSYPVDIHSPDGGGSHFEVGKFKEGDYYTIPYRSLVAKDADNLLAAGRCLSASHEALSAIRVLSAAMATGEAAGTAAALSVKAKVNPAALNTDDLRATLKKQNAIVD